MKINKNSALNEIKASNKVTAISVSKDATPQERAQVVKEAVTAIQSKTRSKANLTVVIAES